MLPIISKIVTNTELEWFGFERIGTTDLEWKHPLLEPVNLWLNYFDGTYHFMMRDNSYQGIGKMTTVEELVDGFKFVTQYDLYKWGSTGFDGLGCQQGVK